MTLKEIMEPPCRPAKHVLQYIDGTNTRVRLPVSSPSHSEAGEARLVRAFLAVPEQIEQVLKLEPAITIGARDRKVQVYLGRGTSFAIALEGALKLKEVSYLHAEGCATGELKHGPIALVGEGMPVVVIVSYDRTFEKTVSNMQEVVAPGGRIILVTDGRGQHRRILGDTDPPRCEPAAPRCSMQRRSARQPCEVRHGGIAADATIGLAGSSPALGL
jgi:fructoselysine-6-P-deglycase FrlB-like protein